MKLTQIQEEVFSNTLKYSIIKSKFIPHLGGVSPEQFEEMKKLA